MFKRLLSVTTVLVMTFGVSLVARAELPHREEMLQLHHSVQREYGMACKKAARPDCDTIVPALAESAARKFQACLKTGKNVSECTDAARTALHEEYEVLCVAPAPATTPVLESIAPPPKAKPEPAPVQAAPKPKPKPKPKPVPVPPGDSTDVVVTNATPTPGEAKKLQKALIKEMGYQPARVTSMNADEKRETSAIMAKPKCMEDAGKIHAYMEREGYVLDEKDYPIEDSQSPYCIAITVGSKRKSTVPAAPPAAVVTTPVPQVAQPQVETKQVTITRTTEPVPPAAQPAAQPVPAKDEDTFGDWLARNKETVNYLLRVPAITPISPTERGQLSLNGRFTPMLTIGPVFRTMFDNPYVPFGFWGGPLLNMSNGDSVISYNPQNGLKLGPATPFGMGLQLGAEAFFFPMVHYPFTETQRGWWIADKIGVGGYISTELMAGMFRPDTVMNLRPWVQQSALVSFGPSVRFDYADWGGVIVRTGPSFSVKYGREDSWTQRGINVLPTIGWGFTVEPFFRSPVLTEWLGGLGKKQDDKKDDKAVEVKPQ
jgi:hypothetical protein